MLILFFYCLDEDCITYTCNGTSAGSIHNYTDVTLQNDILDDIRNKVYNARPYCYNSSTVKAGVYSYQVFLQSYGGSCSSGGTPCFNAEINVRVNYACICDGEGN
ncbi:MAG: hypothetical protein IT267_02670 [Saprospiraceae bacterium]|nr:hypothetical protein [Saprospiraceae bacterium]